MESKVYAIVQWEDLFTSIINLESVKVPRKDVDDYKEGEIVSAPYEKKIYKAVLSEISDHLQREGEWQLTEKLLTKSKTLCYTTVTEQSPIITERCKNQKRSVPLTDSEPNEESIHSKKKKTLCILTCLMKIHRVKLKRNM